MQVAEQQITEVEDATGLHELATRLLNAVKRPSADLGEMPGTSAHCTTKGGSLRHLNGLFKHYSACLAIIRKELEQLLKLESVPNPEARARGIAEIERQAIRLIQWDVVIEGSSYVGDAVHFRHFGRGLGTMCCERLAHNCQRVIRLKGQGTNELLHWIEPPAWFREVQAQFNALKRVGWITGTTLLLLGAAWAFWD